MSRANEIESCTKGADTEATTERRGRVMTKAMKDGIVLSGRYLYPLTDSSLQICCSSRQCTRGEKTQFCSVCCNFN